MDHVSSCATTPRERSNNGAPPNMNGGGWAAAHQPQATTTLIHLSVSLLHCVCFASDEENAMRKTVTLALCTVGLGGCALFRPPLPPAPDPWPAPDATTLVLPGSDAGAVIAAAAALQEFIRTHPDPYLYRGCTHPAQGLDVAVFLEPASRLYFVTLAQRFDRCGGPSGRMLGSLPECAVPALGEVLGESPPPAGEADDPHTPTETPTPQPITPAAPRPAGEADGPDAPAATPPARTPPPDPPLPRTEAGTPAPSPAPGPASPPRPSTPPPAAP